MENVNDKVAFNGQSSEFSPNTTIISSENCRWSYTNLKAIDKLYLLNKFFMTIQISLIEYNLL